MLNTDSNVKSKSSGILEGIRILECSVYLAGPLDGALLSDTGAKVIKIEIKGQGDPGRGGWNCQNTTLG
jgi:crotonobetainyl-CoA:carnitine CoA-transferase CaiB-like acyl-CoA transferase